MPSLTFADMKTELAARGFDDLSDTRLGYFVNQARAELDNSFPWPYRITTASGAAPLTVTDLGQVDEVIDTANSNQVLISRPRSYLRSIGADFTTAGLPAYYYIDNGVIKTWPVGGTLSVRYYKRTPDLSGTQTALAPSDYHLLIVDMAVRWAKKDRDEPDPALDQSIAQQQQVMLDDLFEQTLGPSQVLPNRQITY